MALLDSNRVPNWIYTMIRTKIRTKTGRGYMNFVIKGLGIAALLLSFSFSQAETLFEVEKNSEGKVETVKLKKDLSQLSFDQYMEMYFNLNRQLTFKEDGFSRQSSEAFKQFEQDLKIASPQMRSFLRSSFESLAKMPNWNILAKPMDPMYFTNDQKIEDQMKKIISQLSQVAAGNKWVPVIEFMLTKLVDDLGARRSFFQSALMYQMRSSVMMFNEKDTAGILSSIYASKTRDEKQLKVIAAKWGTYGKTEMLKQSNLCEARMNAAGAGGSVLAVKHTCFGKTENKISNFLLNQSMISQKPATALDLKAPQNTVWLRVALITMQAGARALNINGQILGLVDQFAESFYKEQVKLEGELFASALSEKNSSIQAKSVVWASVNPIIWWDLRSIISAP